MTMTALAGATWALAYDDRDEIRYVQDLQIPIVTNDGRRKSDAAFRARTLFGLRRRSAARKGNNEANP